MLSRKDKTIIRRLQNEMPIDAHPYKVMACEIGITEEELLYKIKKFKEEGIIRRFGATLHHRRAGYKANAMAVWAIPEDKTEKAAELMCLNTQISHCYKRQTSPGWPYNMFAMIHGKTVEECENIALNLSKELDTDRFELLYSTIEVKKSSMKYFLEYE